jgi:hypothetical protein
MKKIGIMSFRRRVGSALRRIIEGGVDNDWKTTKKFITSSNRCVATILLQLEKGEITIFCKVVNVNEKETKNRRKLTTWWYSIQMQHLVFYKMLKQKWKKYPTSKFGLYLN